MATNSSPSGHYNSVGVKGTQIAPIKTRLTEIGLNVPLAKFRSIVGWTPQVSDFIIWHGFFSRWYGVVSAIVQDEVIVIKENLPCLLFSLPQSEYNKNSIHVPIHKIINSKAGEYHVLQGDTWFIEADEVIVPRRR